MARIALRIWSAIISTFAVMAAHSPTNAAVAEAGENLGVVIAQRSKKPELFLEKASTASEQSIVVAAHRSHSSHRSHASHRSGYGAVSQPRNNDTTTESTPTNTINSESSPTYKSVAPSNNTTNQGKEIHKQTSNSSNTVSKIHLSSGGSLDCDFAWQEGDKINVLTKGKVLRFDATEVDIQKTFNK